ncbi:MAG: Mth938-like domain-containing protein [Alphaproteobacteria bacterium]|nr:Mth938-like domain-containing protein [Alphaproteobacteria bacterium]
MELTQHAPAGSLQIVENYGEGSFKVSGHRHPGSILILPDATHSWAVDGVANLSLPSLQPIMDAQSAIEILIVGCGATLALLPVTLREVLRTKGIGLEAMDTGAACRTYNLLAGEGRRVAAALIAL